MKRPVSVVMLALILGEFLAVIKVHVFSFVLFVPVFLMHKIITKKWSIILVVIFLSCFIGFCITKQEISESQLAYSFEETNVKLVGTYIKSADTAYGYQYNISDATIIYKGAEIQLKEVLVYCDEKPEFDFGNKVEVEGALQHFKEAQNYGNFSSKEYYRSLGIYVSVRQNKAIILDSECYPFRNKMQELKSYFGKAFKKLCNDNNKGMFKLCNGDKSDIFCAVILGDKSDLEDTIKNMYQTNGIAHLLAISGLHISAIGIFIFKLFRKKFKFILSAGVAIVVVLGFVFMTGMGISGTRAAGMFVFYLFSQMLGRKYDMLNALSFVAVMLCLDNPFVLLNPAFQMSFGAILAITVINPILIEFLDLNNKRKVQMYFSSISINFIMLPIITFNYFEIPIYSVILNVIVIPFMTVVIISAIGALCIYSIADIVFRKFVSPLIFIKIAKIIIMPGCAVLSFYEYMCEIFSKLPGNILITGKPTVLRIGIYYIVLIIMLTILNITNKRRKKQRNKKEKHNYKDGKILTVETLKENIFNKSRYISKILLLHICMAVLIVLISIENSKNVKIIFNSVGQGDGIVIKNDGFVVMVDGGSTDIKEVGKYRIIPALKARGINEIDYLFVTHADTDHISGIMEMLQSDLTDKIIVKNLMLPAGILEDENYKQLIEAAIAGNTDIRFITKGDYIKYGKLVIKCYYPHEGIDSNDKNSYSTVLDVEYKQFKMLLTGDISGDVETNIVNELGEGYTVLKVAHHGSKYSTTKEFLDKIKPQCSIISCGVNNSYGHPHIETIDKLTEIKTKIFRTDLNGQITITTDGKEIIVETFK